MKAKHSLIWILILLMVASLAGACSTPAEEPSEGGEEATGPSEPASPDADKYGGTLTIATLKDAYNLDPGASNDMPSSSIYDQVFDTLVAFDENLELQPHVAESWDVSDDGTQWTFHIRQGIKFTDGEELTAEDVAFSFQRILDAPEAASQKRSKIAMIDNIEVLDDYTVRFDLSIPYAPFIGAARQHIVPKHVVEAVGDSFGKNPVGSGPYKFVEWVPDDHITLERNEDYWLKKPYLDKIVFKPIPDATVAAMSLLTGEVDVVEQVLGQTIPKMKETEGIDVLTTEGMNYYWIGFRQYGPPYTDVRFREMVYYSVDMDAAIDTIFENDTGSRAYGPVAPGVWPRDLEYMKENAIQEDDQKAKDLYQELLDDGVMTKDTVVDIRVNQDTIREKLGEILVTNLKEDGIPAELQVVEWSAYLDSVTKGTEPFIYMLGTTPAIPDPDAVFNWLFSSGEDGSTHGSVILGLSPQPEINQMLTEARTTPDRATREELYKEIQKWAIIDNVYHIPGYHMNTVIGVSDRVQGLVASPTGDWWFCNSFSNVWVKDQ